MDGWMRKGIGKWVWDEVSGPDKTLYCWAASNMQQVVIFPSGPRVCTKNMMDGGEVDQRS